MQKYQDNWGYAYRRPYRPRPSDHIDIAPYIRARDEDIAELARRTAIPLEDPMTTPREAFGPFLAQAHQHLLVEPLREARKTPEDRFRELDVQKGDRVRLVTKLAPDASSLEGRVIGIKVKNGKSQLRIEGFDHTGPKRNGGQHVWFAVEDYSIEVLHKIYRMTDADKLIAELAGKTEAEWVKLSDDARLSARQTYSKRAERIVKLLSDLL